MADNKGKTNNMTRDQAGIRWRAIQSKCVLTLYKKTDTPSGSTVAPSAI